MMWWNKWFMAVSVSVCSVVHPEIWVPRLCIFSSPYSSRHRLHLWHGLNMFKYHWASNVWWFDQPFPPRHCWTVCENLSQICENDGWKRKVGVKKVSLYTGQCGNKDWCVGYWFPARILWVIQSRQEQIEILLLKRIQNVLLLRWTDNSGLINKALLLNKTVKDTCLSTYCVSSQFKLTTERPHKQTNKQSLGARPNRLLS